MGIWKIIKRWYLLVGITAGLLAIFNILSGWPIRSFLRYGAHQLVSIHSIETFKIETIKTAGGTTLNPPDRFSYKREVPLEVMGTMKLDKSSHVWVVLKDQSASYYLQSPSVEIKGNGQWISYNIRPLADIKQIIWILIDDAGNDFFSRKAEAGEWGKFIDLPQNTQELAYVLML